jgi:sporulation protein YlmC with PRC-barrel domain
VTDPVSWLVIEPGWTAYTSDGKEAGTVDEVLGDENADIFDGLVVSPGRLKRPRYVPAERVAAITNGRVELTITSDAFEQLDEYVRQ